MMAKTGAARQRRMGKGSAMRRLRMLVEIERQAGFGPITCLFVVVFLLCSLAVWLADPVANTFGDGMWFSFQAVSTIGFGDVTAAGPVARLRDVRSELCVVLTPFPARIADLESGNAACRRFPL